MGEGWRGGARSWQGWRAGRLVAAAEPCPWPLEPTGDLLRDLRTPFDQLYGYAGKQRRRGACALLASCAFPWRPAAPVRRDVPLRLPASPLPGDLLRDLDKELSDYAAKRRSKATASEAAAGDARLRLVAGTACPPPASGRVEPTARQSMERGAARRAGAPPLGHVSLLPVLLLRGAAGPGRAGAPKSLWEELYDIGEEFVEFLETVRGRAVRCMRRRCCYPLPPWRAPLAPRLAGVARLNGRGVAAGDV